MPASLLRVKTEPDLIDITIETNVQADGETTSGMEDSRHWQVVEVDHDEGTLTNVAHDDAGTSTKHVAGPSQLPIKTPTDTPPKSWSMIA